MGVIRWHFKLVLDGTVASIRTGAGNRLWHHNGRAGAPTAAAPSATAATAAARALVKPHRSRADLKRPAVASLIIS